MVRDPSKRKATYERHKERNKQRMLERLQSGQLSKEKINEVSRQAKYKARYGLRFDDFTDMLERQKGGCAICGATDLQLNLDHSHVTGRPRAILCFRCNNGLGCFNDDVFRMLDGIKYLMNYKDYD